MTTIRTHPIYVARDTDDKGCGHQHSNPGEAHSCAENMLRRHPTLTEVKVIGVKVGKSGVHEWLLATWSRVDLIDSK